MVSDHHQEMDRFLAGVGKRAYRLAQLAVGNKDDALDIVQDAMFKLVERYGRHRPEEWGPLFRTILYSRIQDWRRREAVRRRFRTWFTWFGDEGEPDPLQQVADTQNPGPDQSLLDRRSMEALGSELRKLPVRQQQAFTLRILEGLNVPETAALMRCSSGSVKTHLSRAVHTLRDKLEDHRS
jgi:RNA polymerase sigma-70 factor (ECF subfamily)